MADGRLGDNGGVALETFTEGAHSTPFVDLGAASMGAATLPGSIATADAVTWSTLPGEIRSPS